MTDQLNIAIAQLNPVVGDVAGHDLPLDDPLADRLREAASGDDAGLADRMLALRAVFPAQVADDDAFRAAVRAEVRDLLRAFP